MFEDLLSGVDDNNQEFIFGECKAYNKGSKGNKYHPFYFQFVIFPNKGNNNLYHIISKNSGFLTSTDIKFNKRTKDVGKKVSSFFDRRILSNFKKNIYSYLFAN